MSAPLQAPDPDLRARLVARVLDLPPVHWLRPIVDDYSAAGGGLLAAGLAFDSLFAILPAILLLVSVLGLFLGDRTELERLVDALAERFPPLEEFFRLALDQVNAGAVSFSIIGLIGLVWGSSRFYQSLDLAIARIFQGSPRRDPIQRGFRGVLSVGLLIGAVAVAVSLVPVVEDLASARPLVGEGISVATSTLGSTVVTTIAFAIAIAFVYRLVPTRTPSWRAISLPSVAAGIAIAILTGLFALLAPRLVGSLRVYGVFVAVFGAMIWLSYVSQTLLVGATWVYRRTPEGAASSAPGPTGR